MLRGEIISVGTELLLGQIVDTNARYLSEQLATVGVSVHWRVTVGDNLDRCAEAFQVALGRADVVIASGGLGPTGDDITREALGRALGTQLLQNEEAWGQLQAFFQRRGRIPSAHDYRQSLALPGARILPNSRGTAPGMEARGPLGGRIFLLPGPPNELIPMFEREVLPYLAAEGTMILSRYLRMVGLPEAQLSELLEDLFLSENPTLAPYASSGELYVRITVRTDQVSNGQEQLDCMECLVRQRVQNYIYGHNDDTLEMVLGHILRDKQLTVAVAESCTGGLLASRLTRVSGSSEYFGLGVVAYSNRSKVQLLGVDEEILAQHGAVSQPVALAMAERIQSLAQSDYGIGITGIAGPSGGSDDKPVGLVYVALVGPGGSVSEHRLVGSREDVQQRAAQQALVQLWRVVKEERA